ncbi:HMG box-containing protein 1 [Homalodisca vitripennis]|nr:HMG box-containing protein 1 [Homalodisca vitripennis]
MSLDESYLHSLDDQPKDLTVKTAKKMKPIPPPLNLTPEEMEKMPLSMLKEFAMIATSPKSPLMQKHLPFRKRAHSIPVNLAKQETGVTIPPTVEENSVSVYESHSIPSSPSVAVSAHRSHIELISSPDLTRDSYVLDLSTGASSVLLSPAPSSLGSSREELTDSAKHLKFMSWNYPWPPPAWHCFQSGQISYVVKVTISLCSPIRFFLRIS